MLSIFMLAATYLSLTLIPSLTIDPTEPCADETLSNDSKLQTQISNFILNDQASDNANRSQPSLGEITSTASTAQSHTGETSLKTTAVSQQTAFTNVSTQSGTLPVTLKSSVAPPVITTSGINQDELKQLLQSILQELGMPYKDVQSMSPDDLIELVLDLLEEPRGKAALSKYIPADQMNEFQKLLESFSGSKTSRDKRDLSKTWKVLKDKLYEIQEEIKAAKYHMFVIVLVLLLVGELFCSPVEKVTDDAWFEFLESIDDLEKYGKHRIWSSIAYILFPLTTTLIVDHTGCLFNLKINHFMVHFYMFGGLLGITFLLGFFFPMSQSVKQKYVSKVGRGFRIVCCNFCNFVYVITLILMGMAYATYNNYLFWLLQDLGSKEITMGLCVMIGSLSELPMLFFSDKFVKKLGSSGVATISLMCLSVRVLIYSFLTSPWVVLPAEVTHAFTHTALWWAVLSQPAFNVTPFVARSVRSILSSMYFGVGFATGSMASGYVYDNYGGFYLFRGTAIIVAAWIPFFFLIQRFFKRDNPSRVKYTRLLQGENDDDEVDDDWLEEALKEH